MLKGAKKHALTLAPPTHVDLFVEYYDLLRQWALKFTKHDHELAEDLLHDAFIHFTLTRPDLASIENIEAFLYVVMRNLHLSQLRRASRTPLRPMSLVEYDTVDVGFWASDPRDRMRLRDDLAAICQYACIRKESSKAGSVLILRFFHGYYPEEIAAVLRTTRAAVDGRLRLARSEAKLYLEDPDRLAFLSEKSAKSARPKIHNSGGELRVELRSQIFASRQGTCNSGERLRQIYGSETDKSIDQTTLAHIVSCSMCIENVNSLLGLPPLASRYPLDTIGKDPGPKDGSGGGGAAGGSKMLDSYLYRSDLHYHHEPQELCVSVNGQLQSFQKVVSGKGELTLIIDTAESLGFVEVFSEQGLRLLMLNVEPPPVGDGEQATHVELSNGRTLNANLDFSGPFPALQVTYNDPRLASEAAADEAIHTTPAVANEGPVLSAAIPFKNDRSGFLTFLAGWKQWLQPARLTAAFAVLVIAALLWVKFAPVGTVSAAELLSRSAEAEAAQLANKDRVLHRVLDLEEYASGGELASRKRIDIWQSAEKGVTARRLYDEQGRLTAGDWRRADGIQTIYKRGEAAKLQPSPEKRAGAIGFDDAWQLSVSAKEFAEILTRIDQAQVETRENYYLITYDPRPEANQSGIIKAAITLSKEDLHAIEQTFTLRNGGETREYRMVESSYEWKPVNAVAPAVFEPNVELTGAVLSVPGTVVTTGALPSEMESSAITNTNSAPSATMATAALEVEVVEALNNAGAFMGEQVNVTRTPDGKILVAALVETDQRKRDLLAALTSYKSNPAVRTRIETVAEVEARAKRQPTRPGTNVQPGTVEQVEVTEGMSPLYAELRKKFSDDEAQRYIDRVIKRSRQAWRHAVAMKQLSGRFSPADLQSLNAAERGRWLATIRGHAVSYLRETEELRRELQQFVPEAGSVGGSSRGAITSDTELQSRARELYEASVTVERGLGRSFALTGQSGAAPVKTAQFWREFANAVGLAKSLQSAK